MAEQPAPHDLAAETGVLGAMLLSADACSTAMAALSADDFYAPRHGHVFEAVVGLWSAGRPVDPVTVADELRTRGLLDQAGGPGELVRLARETPALSNVGRYAGIVAEHAQRRALLRLAGEVADRARALDHPGDIAADLATAAGSVGGHASVPEGFDTLDGMLAAAEADPEPSAWVVPGLLRRSWRAIVTGGEGSGKSTLARQVAVAASAGIHPLTRRNCEPVRVLSIDLENPPEAVAETCAPMVAAARTTRASYDPNRHWFWHRPGGIDVRSRRGRDELEGAIRAAAPDLVAVGPLYKMSRAKASEGWEGPALEVAGVLDDLRTRYGFALLIEAHPAKGESSRKRDLRPEGSSLWMKWPELGFGLAVDRDREDRVEIVRWRGDRLPNQWPVALTRSAGGWPWSGEWAAGTFDPEHPEDPAPMF